ncbi:uncharacterized protein LOC122644878 [Telopea speciosissima]|uniref:uncharacterized protein LOC122644878 n=1 Tax=Telopea speciosissima TaxID=54955 RepID=UPI001CC6CF45|nr:uncharacterized protein LOC122644878 [Telopea speciosissima]
MTKGEQALNEREIELQEQMQEVLKKGPRSGQEIQFMTDLAFIDVFRLERLPKGFKMPPIEQYNGKADPVDHLETFKSLMYLQGASDTIMCKAFPSTLKGSARQWFSHLKPLSLSKFIDLGRAFLTNFMSSRIHKTTAANLLAIRQQAREIIREFLTRFNKEALEVRDLDLMVKFQALSSGIRDRKLKESLIMEEPVDMCDLYSRCEKHINLAEVLTVEQERELRIERKGQDRKEPPVSKNKPKENREQREGKRRRDDRAWVSRSDVKPELAYTPLTHRRAYILNEVKDRLTIHWPTKMVKPASEHNKNKYCKFHQDHGHDTEECR